DAHSQRSLGRLRSEFSAALAAMRERPTYLVLVGIGAFGNLAGLTLAGLFVPFASEVLGLRAVGLGFGLLLSLLGLGALGTSAFVHRRSTIDARGAGLSQLLLAGSVIVAGAVPNVVTSAIAMLIGGGSFAYFTANYAALRQRSFPPELLGRVTMATRTIFYT